MNTSSPNATQEKLLNESNINMNTIRNEANDNNNNNINDDEDEPRSKLVDKRSKLNSKKWIILLILLCLILFFGLIISFLKYRQCNNEKNKCSNEQEDQPDNNYNFVSDSNKNVNNKQHSNSQSKWADENSLNKYWNESRLPSNLVPSHYEINLRINVNDLYFIGNCSIQFYCLKSIKFLVLHVDTNIILNGLPKIYKTTRKNINFEDDNRIIGSAAEQLNVKGIKLNAYYQYVIIELADNQNFESNNNYTVFIENFSSKIGNNLKGIYYSTYNQQNVTK
jgi:hypothetical protein